MVLMKWLIIYANVIFQKGYFPIKWTEGFIVPLHKNGI